MVLNLTSAETPLGRATRQAAGDVLRLSNVTAAARQVARHSRSKYARALRSALDALE
jgi:hypothetical protein